MASRFPYFCKSIRDHWWCTVIEVRAAAHATKDEQIEEVHAPEHEQHHANLYRQGFNSFLRGGDRVAELQRHADVSEIDQVKADNEKVVHGIGECFISVKDIHKKHPSVLM